MIQNNDMFKEFEKEKDEVVSFLTQWTNLTPEYANSLYISHGDKVHGSRTIFENYQMTFSEGLAIYLLTHITPFCHEVRQTENGWIDPIQWVCDNRDRFL